MGARGPQPRFTERLNVMLEPELLADVRAEAERKSIKVSDAVREALQAWLAKARRAK